MVRKGVYFWLILLFVSIFSIPINSASANILSDIPDKYSNEINYLLDRNIITGYGDGTFNPNRLVTREEAATMIGKALHLDGTPRQTAFSDVNPKSYASGYIQTGYEKKIINGYSDGTFGPKKNMTRVEMAFLLTNAFNLTSSSNVFYTDMPTDSSKAKAISSVTNAGVTNGYPDGTFRPNSSITRVEFAVMLARVLNPEFKVDPIENNPVTQYVTVASLNVRSGPSTSYSKVGYLTKGTAVNSYSKTGEWVYIKSGSLSGYVHTAYLSTEKPTVDTKKVIAIDPGHGGKDPGAVANGLKEKDLTLGVGLYLKEYLEQAGIKVIMTRSTDTYLTLDERVAVAEKGGADTFVSLHMNSAGSTASGTETFYTTSGTSDRAKSSKALAEFIQERLVDTLGTKDRGEKIENYRVIYKNSLPAVLVEMGFISNAEEAKLINTHQKETAKAIYMGILDYYKWSGK